MRRSIGLALVATTFALPSAESQEPPDTRPRPPEITTTGEGTRTVQADRASMIIAVETRALTPTAAGSLNAARNTAIRDAIVALGVSREDIATSGYNVYPARREPPYDRSQRDSGYVAINSVRVTLRRPEQLALVGRLIDTALTAGANLINGVRYEARSTDDAERQALADAVADARSRAEAVARAAGGSLGELLGVTTQPPGGVMMDYGVAAGRVAGYPTQITPREIEVRQSVTTRWRFVPARR